MWIRRFFWWLNGNSLDGAVAELRTTTESLEKELSEMREQNAKFRSTAPMWEKTAKIDLESGIPNANGNLTISLDDDLVMWLWRNAWNACSETGDWDLMNACTGIAKAIRDEGVPLGPGLRATALPNVRVIRNDLEIG